MPTQVPSKSPKDPAMIHQFYRKVLDQKEIQTDYMATFSLLCGVFGLMTEVTYINDVYSQIFCNFVVAEQIIDVDVIVF